MNPRALHFSLPPIAGAVSAALLCILVTAPSAQAETLKARYATEIARYKVEKAEIMEQIKEVYAEAKGNGFDTKIMRQILKIRKMDKDDVDEQETLLDLYKQALGMME